jgi:hypothetical protein
VGLVLPSPFDLTLMSDAGPSRSRHAWRGGGDRASTDGGFSSVALVNIGAAVCLARSPGGISFPYRPPATTELQWSPARARGPVDDYNRSRLGKRRSQVRSAQWALVGDARSGTRSLARDCP